MAVKLNVQGCCQAENCIGKSRLIKRSDPVHEIICDGLLDDGTQLLFQHVFHKKCYLLAVGQEFGFLQTGKFSKCPAGVLECPCVEALSQGVDVSTDVTPEGAANFAFNYNLSHGNFGIAASLIKSDLVTSANRIQAFSNGKFRKFINVSFPELIGWFTSSETAARTVKSTAAAIRTLQEKLPPQSYSSEHPSFFTEEKCAPVAGEQYPDHAADEEKTITLAPAIDSSIRPSRKSIGTLEKLQKDLKLADGKTYPLEWVRKYSLASKLCTRQKQFHCDASTGH